MTDAFSKAKEALARYESSHAVDPFRFPLTDHMYLALRGLVASFNTQTFEEKLEAAPMGSTLREEWGRYETVEKFRQGQRRHYRKASDGFWYYITESGRFIGTKPQPSNAFPESMYRLREAE